MNWSKVYMLIYTWRYYTLTANELTIHGVHSSNFEV